ncbi:protein preY, mitochondrial-like isoform X1 [Phoenix dactylifera]|uniref:Protein preY, mitochondrial n=2 Tax=Phoenix dactylifera TaxID=42345 RepID=A0A8B9A6K7_PHODC|nr:protein preY, mitochondrial-like isoform X1 [Phoenix dactylifera]
MVRASRRLLKDAANIGKAFSDFLACPLSKQPLRHCEDSQSRISETIGVSFPIIDGIPCLVPKDGKLLEDQNKSQVENGADPSSGNSERDLLLAVNIWVTGLIYGPCYQRDCFILSSKREKKRKQDAILHYPTW